MKVDDLQATFCLYTSAKLTYVHFALFLSLLSTKTSSTCIYTLPPPILYHAMLLRRHIDD